MGFCSCFNRNLLEENIVLENRKKENFRLYLDNGNLIECIIINSSYDYLRIYAYDLRKLMKSGVEASFIMKDHSKYNGVLKNIEKATLTIITNAKNERQLIRKDIFSIIFPDLFMILKKRTIKKEEITTVEIMDNINPYYGISNIISPGDKISILTNKENQIKGKLLYMDDGAVIVEELNKINANEIKWSEIKKIEILMLSKHQEKKPIIRIILAFAIFIIIIGSLTAVDLSGMGH